MTQILIVEDEPSIVTVIRQRLEREGLGVRAVASGEEALIAFEAQPADLILLDLMLPGIDGLDVLRRLRNGGHTVPVIVLTARDEDVDVIVGLELGADDYVVKPFNPRELVARVRAVLRRQAIAAAPPDPDLESQKDAAQLAGLALDTARRRAWFRRQPLQLRPREFDLLAYLYRNRGQVFSRQTLLSHVWGYDADIDERTVDVHVRRLRAKLAAIDPDQAVILTEWGVGYRLIED
jgi:DNA-binding response OmpR family regulator